MTANSSASRIGRLGRYAVLARWAGGGMADIYVSRQIGAQGFDKLVALKVLRPEFADDPEFRDMFFSEARTAALLSHPNIVQTFDVGESGDQVYMAMEFVNGEPLGRVIRACRESGGVPLPMAVEIGRATAAALHYAHTLETLQGEALDLVHRDVSPSNVMLTHQGSVKLLDFGIAKVSTASHSTRVGVLKGKLAYMSPEQAGGKPLDGRSDVFALGVLLWELITGKRAFKRDSERDTLQAVMSEPLPPASVVSGRGDGDLDAILAKALEKSVDKRYATAEAFANALTRYQATKMADFSPGSAIKALMKAHFQARADKLTNLLKATELDAGQVAQLASAEEHLDLPLANLQSGEFPSVGSQTPSGNSGPRVGGFTPSGMMTMGPGGTPVSVSFVGTPSGQAMHPQSRLGLWIALVALLLAGAAGAYFALRGPAAPRSLTVNSPIADATVSVDGVERGRPPVRIDVPSDHAVEIRVTRRGYVPFTQRVEAGDEAATVAADLERADEFGSVIVDSTPPGATVKVDGEVHPGTTPLQIGDLWVGDSHRLTLTMAGYAPSIQIVDFDQSDHPRVSATMIRATGAFVSARCAPTPCEVFVAGESVGVTPIENHQVPSGVAIPVELRRGDEVVQRRVVTLTEGALEEFASAPAATPTAVAALIPGHPVRRPVHRVGMRDDGTTEMDEPTPVAMVEAVVEAPAPPPVAMAATPPPAPTLTAPTPSAPVVMAATPVAPMVAAPRTLTPTAHLAAPSVRGVIDRGSLTTAVASLEAGATRCYATAYRTQAFEGTVNMRFIINTHGRAGSVSATGPGGAGLASCLENLFTSRSFPASTASDATVTLRVRLQAR